jgi:acyl carrier protein
LLEKDFPELTPSTDLVEDLSLESIQVMDFIADVEDHFDILIEVDRLASIRTVAQLAALVEEMQV